MDTLTKTFDRVAASSAAWGWLHRKSSIKNRKSLCHCEQSEAISLHHSLFLVRRRPGPALTGSIFTTTFFFLLLLFLIASPAQAKYGGGSGTAEDPFLIFTADHFRAIGDQTEHMTSHFRLMEDIDLSGLPITIVHIGQPFRGTFDGNGKKIYNYRKEEKSGFKGLFGWIYGYQSHAEIKNLTLVNPIMILEKDIYGGLLADDVTGDAAVVGCHVVNGYIESATQSSDTTGGEVAGLVAWNEGTIVDCTVTGTIIGHSAGGLVSNNKGTIRNCGASVEVLANQSAGGLATYNYGIVERCSTTGKVESISTLEWLSIGGLVGSNHCYGEGGGGIISDCHSSSDITLNGKCGGGLVGISWGGMITNSYATGSVTGTSASYIGGLVGTIVTSIYNPYMGIIEYCYATGDVSGNNRVGGLVGESGSSIVRNCYATGAVSANNRVGGLMGVNYFYPYNGFGTAIIDKCYSTGQVTGNKKAGGLVGGYWPYRQIVTNSFWDIETSEQATSAGGTGKTTAAMQTISTFTDAGWDFITPAWTIDEGNDYPRLWWELAPVLHAEPEVTLGTSNTISWDPVPGDVEYYAECAADANFTNILYNTGWITETSYEFTDLELGQRYWYSVKARNAAGTETGWSNVEFSLQVTLGDAVDIMLAPDTLKNKNMKNALLNKINAVQQMLDAGLYADALNKLQNDILQKTNGCVETGRPDKNDWIITCEGQSELYPLIIETIEYVKSLME